MDAAAIDPKAFISMVRRDFMVDRVSIDFTKLPPAGVGCTEVEKVSDVTFSRRKEG
jgi:hypothetical protein